jgi:radical SAM protein with 4Fe4S-binding SPASM domain
MELRTISQYLASLFVHNGIDACRLCSSGDIQLLLAVDYDGQVYPCDYFWKDKNLAIGNIEEQSVNAMSNSKKNLRMRNINETECSDCTWKSNCGGECLASNYYSDEGKSPYCKTHKVVYNHLAKQMPELIERNLIKPILLWSVK